MQSFEYVITDEVGIHARPAGLLVKEAKGHADSIMVMSNGKTADAKKLMALMALGVKKGDCVRVNIEGESEAETATAMEDFFKKNL